MSVVFVTGDLFDCPGLDAMAHGCNCAGGMGKGIAVEFKRRFPAMYRAYHEMCKKGQFNLSDVFAWEEGEITVFNLGTQKTWRTEATLPAIEASVERMLQMAVDAGVERIGIPRVGAGYGGLKWENVKQILVKVAGDSAVELVVFETYKKAEPGAEGRAG